MLPKRKKERFFKITTAIQILSQSLLMNVKEMPILTIFSIIFEGLQIASFNILKDPKNSELISGIKWFSGYELIFILIRPGVLFPHLDYDIFNYPVIIIISIISLVFLISMPIIYYLENTQKKPILSEYLMTIFITFSGFINSLMVIPSMDCLLYLLFQGTFGKVGTEIPIVMQLLCGFVAILIIIISVFGAKFGEMSMTIHCTNLQRLFNTNLNLISNQIKIVLILIYCVNPEGSQVQSALTFTFSLLHIFLKFLDFFKNIPYPNITKSTFYLLAQSIALSFIMIAPFYTILELMNKKQLGTFCFLVIPIITKLFLNRWNQILNFYICDIMYDELYPKKDDYYFLHRKIGILVGNQQNMLYNKQIYVIAVIERHRLRCQDVFCFCKSGSSILGKNSTDFLLSQQNFERYIRILIRMDINHNNNQLKDAKEAFIRFVQQMDYMSKTNKHCYALKTIIYLINENDRMKRSMGLFVDCTLLKQVLLIRKLMHYDIMQDVIDPKIENMEKSISLFIKMQNIEVNICGLINEALEYRMKTLDTMKKGYESAAVVEKTNIEYTKKLDDLEQKCQNFYQVYSTNRNQSLLTFFHAEIKGDQKQADHTSKSHSYSQIDELQNHKTLLIDVFSDQVVSATVTFGRVFGKIVHFSDKFPQTFGYKKQEMAYMNSVKELMPAAIGNIHDELIKYLLITGDDRMVNTQRVIFGKNKDNFLIKLDAFFAFNTHYQHELPYIVYFNPFQTLFGHMIINQKGQITSFDQQIFQLFRYKEVENLPLNISIEADKFLPQIQEYFLSMEKEGSEYYTNGSAQLCWPKKTHQLYRTVFTLNNQELQSERQKKKEMDMKKSKASNRSKISHRSQQNSQRSLSRTANMWKLKADLSIQKRQIQSLKGKITYYIVEIRKVYSKGKGDDATKTFGTCTVGTSIAGSSQIGMSEGSQNFDLGKSMVQSQQPQQFGVQSIMPNVQQQGLGEPDVGNSAVAQGDSEICKNLIKPPTLIIDVVDDKNQLQAQLQNVQPSTPRPPEDPYKQSVLKNPQSSKSLNPNKLTTQEDFQFETGRESNIQIEEGVDGMIHTTRPPELNKPQLNQEQDQLESNYANNSNDTSQQDITGRYTVQSGNNTNRIQAKNGNLANEVILEEEQSKMEDKTQDLLETQGSPPQNLMMQSETAELINEDVGLTSLRQNKQDFQKNHQPQNQDPNDKSKIVNSITIDQETKNANEKNILKILAKKHQNQENNMYDQGSTNSAQEIYAKGMEKYGYYKEFINSSQWPISLKLIYALKATQFLLLVLTSVISLTTIYSSFQELVISIENLSVHSQIIAPYGDIVGLARIYKQSIQYPVDGIDPQVYIKRLQFEFDVLNENFHNLYDNTFTTTFLTNNEIQVFNIYKDGKMEEKTFSLLTATGQLMNHINIFSNYDEQDFEKFEQDEKFIIANFYNFMKPLFGIIEEILEKDEKNGNSLTALMLYITIALNIITLGVFIVSFYNYHLYQKIILSLLYLVTNSTISAIEKEFIKIRKVQGEIKENEDTMFAYVLNLNNMEDVLNIELVEEQGKQQNRGNGQKRDHKVKIKSDNLNFLRFLLISLLSYVIFLVYSFMIYYIAVTFLNNFRPALEYFKRLADAQCYIPSLYSLKSQIEYYRNDSDFPVSRSSIISEYTNILEEIGKIKTEVYKIEEIAFYGADIREQILEIFVSDMCADFGDNFESGFCQKTWEGTLERGLIDVFTKFQSQYQRYYEQGQLEEDYITQSDEIQYIYENYVAITTTKALYDLLEILQENLLGNTQDEEATILLISVIYLLVILILYSYDFYKEMALTKDRFTYAKKIIFMLPTFNLLCDDNFLKQLKAQTRKLQLVKS